LRIVDENDYLRIIFRAHFSRGFSGKYRKNRPPIVWWNLHASSMFNSRLPLDAAKPLFMSKAGTFARDRSDLKKAMQSTTTLLSQVVVHRRNCNYHRSRAVVIEPT
jgi:hypothetical protein